MPYVRDLVWLDSPEPGGPMGALPAETRVYATHQHVATGRQRLGRRRARGPRGLLPREGSDLPMALAGAPADATGAGKAGADKGGGIGRLPSPAGRDDAATPAASAAALISVAAIAATSMATSTSRDASTVAPSRASTAATATAAAAAAAAAAAGDAAVVAAPAVFESLVSVEDPATTALVVAVASVEAAADNMTSAVLPAAVDATTTVVVAAV